MPAGERSEGGSKDVVTRCALRDGEVWVREPRAGFFVVSWYPRREDHPDYPGVTVDSERERMPVEGGVDAVVDWARGEFEGRDPRDLLEVVLDAEAGEDEVAAVSRAFDEAGVPAVVTARVERRGAMADLPWIAVIAAPLVFFVKKLAEHAAEDGYKALRRFIVRVYEARRGRPGSIEVRDGERAVILTDRIPDEGLRELAEGEFPPGYYVWDDDRGGWQRH